MPQTKPKRALGAGAMRLKDKLFICLAAVVALTTLLMGAISHRVAISALRREAQNINQATLTLVHTMLEDRMRLAERNLQMAIDYPDALSTLHVFAQRVEQTAEYLRYVMLLDAGGEVLIAHEPQNAKPITVDPVALPSTAQWRVYEDGLLSLSSVYEADSGEWLKVLAVWDTAMLEDITREIARQTGRHYAFFDKEQVLLPSSSGEDGFIRQAMEQRIHQQYPGNTGIYRAQEMEQNLYALSESGDYGWRILMVTPQTLIDQSVTPVHIAAYVILCLMIILALILSETLSGGMMDNVRLLLMSMNKFAADINYKPLQPLVQDEVGELAQRFNQMAEQIQQLVASNYQARIDRQRAEFRTLQFEYKALQAQMDPHFLYNTLENIHALAELSGQSQISELTFRLGKLLRESIGRKGDYVTLRDEIEFSDGYLAIQKIVYQEHIQVYYGLVPETLELYVPKFILQPIVENAIQHGIEEKPGQGVVFIESFVRDHELLISVTDNGVGMSEERMTALLDHRPQARPGSSRHARVGIFSVHRRIFMRYGEPYGVRVQSAEGHGTRMSIALPLLTSADVSREEEPVTPEMGI